MCAESGITLRMIHFFHESGRIMFNRAYAAFRDGTNSKANPPLFRHDAMDPNAFSVFATCSSTAWQITKSACPFPEYSVMSAQIVSSYNPSGARFNSSRSMSRPVTFKPIRSFTSRAISGRFPPPMSQTAIPGRKCPGTTVEI